ncbi:hypothetical protein, partial [Parasphingorhabdus sp.]|uniref:hypothetical protein n=1 Tax=Parasphingorhabdus sp. TaxID=2709688 RepID=UPI00300330A0
MMNLLKPAVAALFAVSMLSSGAAHAQFGGLGKAIKKEAKQTKRDAEREAVNEAENAIDDAIRGKASKRGRSGKGGSSGSGGSTTLGTPSSALTSQTQCAGIALSNVTVGNLGSYTFQQGFSKEKRTGFIN